MSSQQRATEPEAPRPGSMRPTPASPLEGLFESSRDAGFWEIDRNLPRWARRTNPIVRRHLGGFLAAPLPQLDVLGRIIGFQVALVLLSIAMPVVLEFSALIGLVSLVVLPVSLSAYAGSLFLIGRAANSTMLAERETGALDTLRITPLTLRSILLSKIAAALWQQAVNLDTIILATALFSLPVLTILHASLYDPAKFPLESRFLIIGGLIASVLRLALEPFMVGALGILTGALARQRLAGATAVTILTATYFTLISLPRLAILPWQARFVVETIAPVILPILVSAGALALAERLLLRD